MNKFSSFFLLLLVSAFSTISNSATLTTYNFSGSVSYPNGSMVQGANVSVYNISFTSGAEVFLLNSTTTDSNGNFTILVNASPYDILKVIISKNDSGKYFVNIPIPNVPAFLLNSSINAPGLLGRSIRLVNGTFVNINAINSSGDPEDFWIDMKMLKYGISVISNSNTSNSVAIIPSNYSYSLVIGSASNDAPPVSFYITSSDLSSGEYSLTVNFSLQYANLTGNLSIDGGLSGFNFTDLKVYPLSGNEVFYQDNCLFCGLDPSEFYPYGFLNETSGEFTLPVPFSSSFEQSFMLFASAQNGTDFYGTFHMLNLSPGQNLSLNLSLHPLSGEYYGVPSSFPTSLNSSKYLISVRNESGDSISYSAFIMLDVETIDGNNSTIHFNMSTFTNDSGDALFPVVSGSNITAFVFGNMNPPRKSKINTSAIAQNITIPSLTGIKNDSGGLISSMNITVLFSNDTCDVPYPPSSCKIIESTILSLFSDSGSSASKIDPFGFALAQIPVTIKFSEFLTGMSVLYETVDMLASQPPDFQVWTTTTKSSSSGSLEMVRKFGASIPLVFSEAIVSYNYSDSEVNDSADIRVMFKKLYDDDWNEVWNFSQPLSKLPAYYSDYNSGIYSCLLDSSSNGCLCDTTDQSSVCFVNTTDNRIWVRIPHFSGGDLALIATPPSSSPSQSSQSTSQSSTSSSTSSGSKVFSVDTDFDCSSGTLSVSVGSSGATVKFFSTSPESSYSVSKTSGDSGNVSFSISESGEYKLKVSKNGYQTYSITDTFSLCEQDSLPSVKEEESSKEKEPENNSPQEKVQDVVTIGPPEPSGVEEKSTEPVSPSLEEAISMVESAKKKLLSYKNSGVDVSSEEKALLEAEALLSQGSISEALEIVDSVLSSLASKSTPQKNTSEIPVKTPQESSQSPSSPQASGDSLILLGSVVVLAVLVLAYLLRKNR